MEEQHVIATWASGYLTEDQGCFYFWEDNQIMPIEFKTEREAVRFVWMQAMKKKDPPPTTEEFETYFLKYKRRQNAEQSPHPSLLP